MANLNNNPEKQNEKDIIFQNVMNLFDEVLNHPNYSAYTEDQKEDLKVENHRDFFQENESRVHMKGLKEAEAKLQNLLSKLDEFKTSVVLDSISDFSGQVTEVLPESPSDLPVDETEGDTEEDLEIDNILQIINAIQPSDIQDFLDKKDLISQHTDNQQIQEAFELKKKELVDSQLQRFREMIKLIDPTNSEELKSLELLKIIIEQDLNSPLPPAEQALYDNLYKTSDKPTSKEPELSNTVLSLDEMRKRLALHEQNPTEELKQSITQAWDELEKHLDRILKDINDIQYQRDKKTAIDRLIPDLSTFLGRDITAIGPQKFIYEYTQEIKTVKSEIQSKIDGLKKTRQFKWLKRSKPSTPSTPKKDPVIQTMVRDATITAQLAQGLPLELPKQKPEVAEPTHPGQLLLESNGKECLQEFLKPVLTNYKIPSDEIPSRYMFKEGEDKVIEFLETASKPNEIIILQNLRSAFTQIEKGTKGEHGPKYKKLVKIIDKNPNMPKKIGFIARNKKKIVALLAALTLGGTAYTGYNYSQNSNSEQPEVAKNTDNKVEKPKEKPSLIFSEYYNQDKWTLEQAQASNLLDNNNNPILGYVFTEKLKSNQNRTNFKVSISDQHKKLLDKPWTLEEFKKLKFVTKDGRKAIKPGFYYDKKAKNIKPLTPDHLNKLSKWKRSQALTSGLLSKGNTPIDDYKFAQEVKKNEKRTNWKIIKK